MKQICSFSLLFYRMIAVAKAFGFDRIKFSQPSELRNEVEALSGNKSHLN